MVRSERDPSETRRRFNSNHNPLCRLTRPVQGYSGSTSFNSSQLVTRQQRSSPVDPSDRPSSHLTPPPLLPLATFGPLFTPSSASLAMSDSTADEIRAAQAARREAKRTAESTQRPESESDKVSMTGVSMDMDVYDSRKGSRFANHDLSIAAGPAGDEDDDLDDEGNAKSVRLLDSCELQTASLVAVIARIANLCFNTTVTAPKHLLNEFADEDAEDPFAASAKSRQIASRQSEYHARRFDRDSGVQVDAFAADDADKGVQGETNTYADQMRRAELEREELRVRRAIEKQQEEGVGADGQELKQIEAPDETPRGKRWDDDEPERPTAAIKDVDMSDGTRPRGGEWDDANTQGKEAAAAAAAAAPKKKRSRWDETPVGTTSGGGAPGETPKRSRWDQTPVGGVAATPRLGAVLPYGMTPVAGLGGEGVGGAGVVVDPRNRYLSDEELNAMLPMEGYEIVEPPAGYAPIRTPSRKLQETPMAANGGGFTMQEDAASASMLGLTQELPTEIEGVGDLQFFKQEDAQYFAKASFRDLFISAEPRADSVVPLHRSSATRTRALSPLRNSRSARSCACYSRSRTERLQCARPPFVKSPTRLASSAQVLSSTRSFPSSWSALSRTRSATCSSRSSTASSTSSTTWFAPTSTRFSS